MHATTCVLLIVSALSPHIAESQINIVAERRRGAAAAFRDGVVVLHANPELSLVADGFRQDPHFYYFTGLENTVGAVLVIEGKSGESWLFVPPDPPYSRLGLEPEVRRSAEDAKRWGVEHIDDWMQLERFLVAHAKPPAVLYYVADEGEFDEAALSSRTSRAPQWLQMMLPRWPTLQAKDATSRIEALMDVQTEGEITALRSAARTTASAIMAGLKAIRPGTTQRSVEGAVSAACWSQGAHGPSFWPWVMAGENAVFPRPFFSDALYSHLNRTMLDGELVRLDVGCEWEHYRGDLGRTVPVSGHYDDAQRETWSIFVAAYQAGARALREGVTGDQVFEAWRKELISHRTAAKSTLAKHAIDSWSDRKNVPYWAVHTTNLIYGYLSGPLRAGTTINFEPIASVDGQGFYLEDMYLIRKEGAELLTPGVPYSAEEIEAAMK